MKYPISSVDLLYNNPNSYKKMGYNFSEHELFEDINEKMGLTETATHYPIFWRRRMILLIEPLMWRMLW